jgi:hypothetical protein
LPAAMRHPGQPASGRSRFGVALQLATRASASSQTDVALAVFRVPDGMRWDSKCGHVGCGCREGLVARTRRLLIATQVDLSLVIRAGISSGNPIDALANDPSLQALPLHLGSMRRHHLNVRDTNRDSVHPSPKPGHAPTRSLARCSATQRLELSRPG